METSLPFQLANKQQAYCYRQHSMAAPLLLRGIAYLRLRLHHQHQDQHRISGSLFPIPRRLWCTAAAPTRSDENLSPTDSATADWSAGDFPRTLGARTPTTASGKSRSSETSSPLLILPKIFSTPTGLSLSLCACPQIRPKTWYCNLFCYCVWLRRKSRKRD